MTKNFSIVKLKSLEFGITVLRSCSAIPFPLVIEINANLKPIQAAIQDYQESIDLFNERKNKIVEEITDPVDQEKANKEVDQEYLDFLKKEYTVDITEIPASKFDSVNVDGVKEVRQQNGAIEKFLYRDAYFTLIDDIIV